MDATPEADGQPGLPGLCFSHAGITPLGKCTATLKTHVPDEIDDEFQRIAAEQRCTPSELLRDMVCLVVRKKTYGELSAQDRRSLAETSGPGKDFFEGQMRASTTKRSSRESHCRYHHCYRRRTGSSPLAWNQR